MNDFLERDLERIITESDFEEVIERGLPISLFMKSQIDIPNYGRLDVISLTRKKGSFVLDLWELKKGEINVDTFWQAVRYARGVQLWIRDNKFIDIVIRINLVGRKVDLTHQSFCFLADVLPIRFYTYEYNIDGIEFTREYGFLNREK